MIISPRKKSSRRNLGIFRSLIAVMSGACVFLVLLQSYTKTFKTPQISHENTVVYAYDQPLLIFSTERACFRSAPQDVAVRMKRVVLQQMVALRTGDYAAAQKLLNVPPQGLCPLHMNAVLRSSGLVATSKLFKIDHSTLSPDLDKGLVYCELGNRSQPDHAIYCMVLNTTGEWRIQNVETLHNYAPYSSPQT